MISVESNDPNQTVIKLTLLATVEVELSFDPVTAYFRNMNQGEQSNQRVHLKNTSKNILNISSVNVDDNMITVDLINRTPDWPIELKPEDSLDFLVSFRYQLDKPRFSKQIRINYNGGEGNVAYLRVYATLKQAPQKPQTQTKPFPENMDREKDVKPTSIKTLPSKEVLPLPPPPPPYIQPKGEINKPEEKAPEKGKSPL